MNEMVYSRWGLNGFALKCIAMVTMLTDHMGMALYPQYQWLRIVGRIAFPIYCFLLVEGAVHTSNRGRYLRRLFLFALISEIPYDLVRTGTVWDTGGQNVFFTLFLGLLAIGIIERLPKRPYGIFLVAVLVCAAEYGGTDYGAGGMLIILCFYVFYQQKYTKSVVFAAVNLFCYGGVQNYALLSLPPLLCYNGKRGPNIKYLFYIFYPAHLLVLYWIKYKM